MFSASFPGDLRVRKVRKILGVFEVFLGIFEKTKEKKDREFRSAHMLFGARGFSVVCCGFCVALI